MSNISLNYAQIIDPLSFKSINLAKIYIGEYGTLPNPANAATWKQAYFVNSDGTRTAASQPIRTNAAGYAVDGSGNIKTIQVDGGYSLLVQDQYGATKFSQARSAANSGAVLEFDTIAGFTGALDGSVCYFKGRDTVGDGGGGVFRYSASSTLPADGGLVFAPSGGGRLFRDGWTVFGFNGQISARWFGAKGDGVAYDTTALRSAIAAAKATKAFLDLTGAVGWRVDGELDFTGVSGVICAYESPILVDVAGTYTNGYAVQFGNPAVAWDAGRHSGCVIAGTLHVVASSRTTPLNGVYMKGSWFNAGHIMAYGFNGCGIRQDSVWDSTFARLYVELCGNTSTYALRLDSNGDTHNASHIASVQCEQAYHKGMYIKTLRTVIDNIHAERLAVLTTNDGTATYGYMNHIIDLSNSQINQVVIDCLTSGTAPDGSSLAATMVNIQTVGDNSKISTLLANHSRVINNYGTLFEYAVLSTVDFVQRAPAAYTTVNTGRVSGVFDVERSVTASGCSIGEFRAAFNATDITVNGGDIATLSFPNSILGNIQFDSVVLQTVGDTKEPAAGKKPVTFENCNINVFNGAFNAKAKVTGGYVGTCSLASQSMAEFDGVEFGTFSYSGNTAFLTRNCRGPSGSTWSVPLNMSYPAGTVTERVGYNSAGKIYQNTDGGTTWAKIA